MRKTRSDVDSLGQDRRTSPLVSAIAAGTVIVLAPLAAMAAPFTYTPPAGSNTSGTPDLWSAGPAAGWDSTPASATDTTLVLNVPGTTGVTRFTSNDVANPFVLNVLTLAGSGPSGAGATSTLTVQGSTLSLTSDVATLPVVNLNASRGTGTPTPTLTVNVSTPLTLTNNTTFQGNGNAGYTFSGAITGSGTFTKTGTSAMTISSASNSYGGSTSVSAGSLVIGTSNVIPNGSAVSVSGTGLIDFVGRSDTFASLTLTGTGSINQTSATITISGAMTNSSTSTASSGAALPINSGGNFTINGLATFNAASQTLLGGASGTRLNLNGGVAMTGATIRMNAGADSRIVLGSNVTVNDPGNATNSGVVYTTTNTNNRLDLNGANRTFTVADGSNAVDFNLGVVVVSVTGTGALTKAGPGTMALGSAGTYTGGTTVSGGTLAAQANGSLGTGNVTVDLGATLDLSNAAVTTGAIADAATLSLSSSGPTFSVVAFGSSTLNELVGSLLVNGTPQALGTYNSSNLSNFITGSGSITVVPEPGSLAAVGAVVSLAALRRRRRS